MPDLRLWSDGQLLQLREEMDKLFDGFCSDMGLPSVSCLQSDEMTICREDERIVISQPLPGYDAEDIEISLTEKVLGIEAQTKSEREYSHFSRTLELPCRVDPKTATATISSGVLTIRLNRTAAPKARRIPVIAK
ncbi:Hsp20/alpha crystallin family protein [Desulfobaculum bizertense]|uniref:HSP20 family protein n=1 Tax=Desulfobaculum bizertense DSM 18034 TaxID=1121442 RepID=A0A1T4WCQ3_9BACT|nr:Hsp20/alpha crystallin family protein [Desulfobaculum bizertense]UIJ37400.1 Hsp20/alpha crystallin family protein [Desulfobaculum bizertense]SKA75086.1 HSP20 family protein [Desulfobaculum bizertense DSM 18034]